MGWTVANFVALAVTLLLLALVSVALRFWARSLSNVRIGSDDVLIVPAVTCLTGMTVTIIVGTQVANMAQHQAVGQHAQDPSYLEALVTYGKINYALQILNLTSLGLSKLSVLCFYRRMFFVHARFIVINTFLIIFVAAWLVIFLFGTMFQCKHMSTLWTPSMYAREGCVKYEPFFYALFATGVVGDLATVVSPLPVIARLKLPLRSRIAVAAIFLLGALVCGASVARFVAFIEFSQYTISDTTDVTYYPTTFFAWSLVECSLGIAGANLPLLRPLLRRDMCFSSYVRSLMRRKRSGSTKNEDIDLERVRIVRTKSMEDDKSSSRHVDNQESSAVSLESSIGGSSAPFQQHTGRDELRAIQPGRTLRPL